MKLLWIVALIASVSCLDSCLRRLTESEVIGTYKAESDSATSTLTLKPDHTFEQTVTDKNGKTSAASGHWSLELKAPGSSIGHLYMTECLAFDHETSSGKWAGSSSSVTALGFTTVEIAVDLDWGIAYRK